jgi:hypothetical protein
MPLLALLFLVTAALYASVGLGGGSTYNALLVLADTDYRILPSVALVCNLIVGRPQPVVRPPLRGSVGSNGLVWRNRTD